MNFGDFMYKERKDLTDGEKEAILLDELILNGNQHCAEVVQNMFAAKYPELVFVAKKEDTKLEVYIAVLGNPPVVLNFDLGEVTTLKGFSEFGEKLDQTVAQIKSQ